MEREGYVCLSFHIESFIVYHSYIVYVLTRDGLITPDGHRVPVGEWLGSRETDHDRDDLSIKVHNQEPSQRLPRHYERGIFYVLDKTVIGIRFQKKYPGKKFILILDNALYHHVMVSDGFRPDNMSKEDICERLSKLTHKRGVHKLTKTTITPYSDNPPPPALPSVRIPDHNAWDNFVVLENTGELWIIDGMSDQGHGEVIVYSRVGQIKRGVTESTHVQTFIARLTTDHHKAGPLVFNWIW